MVPSNGRKQIVSVRLDFADLDKVKAIANRLQVRESEVFRFALKVALARLGPLHKPEVGGRELMPVFADCGIELTHYFGLDEDRLFRIINSGVEFTEREVEKDDIALLALSAMPDSFTYVHLRERLRRHVDPTAPETSLRDYLFRKYVAADLQDEPEGP